MYMICRAILAKLRRGGPARRAGGLGLVRAGGLGVLLMLGGCSTSTYDGRLVHHVRTGEFGLARGHLNHLASANPGQARQLLSHLNLGVVNLADGLASEAEEPFQRAYEILRLRDINAGTRLTAAITYEGVRYFKGEPFEQAMAYCYIALQKAAIGDYDNCRAAANAALELLDEFDSFRGTTDPVPQGFSYAVYRNQFALAYLLSAIGNLGMGRQDEAEDFIARVTLINPSLGGLARALLDPSFNTVLVIDAGAGPRKVAMGDGGVGFISSERGTNRPIDVFVNGITAVSAPPAANLDALAQRYSWDELRAARQAKEAIGTGLVIGGAVIATQSRDDEARLAGLAMIAAGLIASAMATPDLRQVDIFPQRVYIVPLRIESPGSTIQIAFGGQAVLTIPSIDPPSHTERLKVRSVRLPASVAWVAGDQVLYANDGYGGYVPGQSLPYILGGTCVRMPTHALLAEYQRAGYLTGMTLGELLELYRLEGIRLGTDGSGGRVGGHVLEGGSWLYTPQDGTAGYARLFGRTHRPYRPKSEAVRRLAAEMQALHQNPTGRTP